MANPTVTLNTSKGAIAVELFADRAPKSVDNFLQYARDGHYDGTVFHRVIPGFMVQGGGFTPDLQQKPTRDPIQNEADNGLKNERGTLAMARTADIHSATSQFFINVADNDFLNHGGRDFGYAVFGRVTGGMDVVDAIVNTPTGAKGPFAKDCPVEDITIDSVATD
jgi:cyclophilin family peptidyl-prolyl cis-trans isomerase